MNPYIGHDSQLRGMEEHRLVGGKGDGMRLLQLRNGKGLEMTVLPDRCCDISRVYLNGVNLSYISPCGYVAPSYFDASDWLRSFTAGFLTTCGLQNVGSPNTDAGEKLELHGSIANQPADQVYWYEDEDALIIKAVMKDEVIFGRKLRLDRVIRVSLWDNSFTISDTIENTGDRVEPFEILYHMNMGYPLLDEDSVVQILSSQIIPRDEHAAEDIQNCLKMEKPQHGYVERCYYHKFSGQGRASIYQPKLNVGVEILFDSDKLDGFVEWKMMGFRDYVLGLECGNCYADGRDVMRRTGMLKFLQPGEKVTYDVKVILSSK